jgi:hypothetical protein
MIARYNRKSLIFGVPGLVLQIGGNAAVQLSKTAAANAHSIAGIGAIACLIGTVLFLVGLAFYAKAKGRHPAWCLMAFLSIIGVLVLAGLKDNAPSDTPSIS